MSDAKQKAQSVTNKTLDAIQLARFFDHTVLGATVSEEQIRQLCAESAQYGFYAVCVNPCFVSFAKKELLHSKVLVCTVAGFPLGQNLSAHKAREAADLVASGADEIDVVMNISWLKEKRYRAVENELAEVVVASGDAAVKVIIETALLNTDEIASASRLCEQAGAKFVKTSTGFSTRGASVEDVQVIKKNISASTFIKASGGIKTLNFALQLIEAGATRLGSSSSVKIIGELT